MNLNIVVDAEKDLLKMLEVAGLRVKASYNPAEVGMIFEISYPTFNRMCNEFEYVKGMEKPGTLNSFWVRGERRVAFPELVRYLAANNSYQRSISIPREQLAFKLS